MDNHHCRFCGHELKTTFVDLGLSPLANEYLQHENLHQGQMYYPLKVQICENCFLAQTELYQKPEAIFSEYQYFSSYSTSWLAHCKTYVDMIIPTLRLNTASQVLEVACNDGYLLQYFEPYGITARGVEPAENVAAAARAKGISVRCCFFCEETAKKIVKEDGQYDLIIGNNVLAHVPDINSFVSGLAVTLKPEGTITMEFPHLLRLIQNCQFDTIYHEHFYYLSLTAVQKVFRAHGLVVYDVEELNTHGGSLRIYAAHEKYGLKKMSPSVEMLTASEKEFGICNMQTYTQFTGRILRIKLDTLHLLTELRKSGKHIAAFGAAAKGNTFLNYCGIKNDVIEFVVDSNPHKQGLYLPGSLIPILPLSALEERKPEYLLILPWNLSEEIEAQAAFIRNWGGKFIICIPSIHVF